jgi:hypothetical protein
MLFIVTGNVTVLLGGSDVQDPRTTGVSPSGCSVMAKMTAGMEVMSCHRTAPSVTRLEISAVQTIAAFPSKCLWCKYSFEIFILGGARILLFKKCEDGQLWGFKRKLY